MNNVSVNVSLCFLFCIQSMPSIEEATELSSSGLDEEYKEVDTPCVSSTSLGEQEVSIPALLAVINHKVPQMRNDSSLPPGCLSQEEHTEVSPYESSDWDFA